MDTIEVTANADALCTRTEQLINAGRPGAARPLLAAARRLATPSPRLALLAARLAISEGALEKAQVDLDSAIAEWPDNAGLRKCRATVRGRTGDAEGAVRDAAEAVILDRDDPHAKAILGAALHVIGRFADAVACLTEAVAAMPASLTAWETLAAALEAAGDANAALGILTDRITQHPGAIGLRNAAILLCLRRRDFIQADRLAEQARALGIADACTFGMKGHALSSLGHHEQAATAYQDAYKLGPDDPYVRYLVIASGAMPGASRAPQEYVATVFNGYADRFDDHLIALGYSIPGAIRSALLAHPRIEADLPIGPVLDLGCGTGLATLAVNDLPAGPFTGVDLSRRMLDHARAKQLYDELREADIVTDLQAHPQRWPLVLAADVLCYFGALEEVLALVHARLETAGWFIFSVEELVPDHDGVVQGDGRWALQRLGRYAHAAGYVQEAAIAAGFRVLRVQHLVARLEAGVAVPGLLLALERLEP
jgi:predicted TPR repeat methyltransferase/thioredoxin-like negative regulator of GroEL